MSPTLTFRSETALQHETTPLRSIITPPDHPPGGNGSIQRGNRVSLLRTLQFALAIPGFLNAQRRLEPEDFFELAMERLDAEGLMAWRARSLAAVRGRVLDVGVGTGRSFPLYGPRARVVGLEPDAALRKVAAQRGEIFGFSVLGASAEHLPFVDGHFDAVAVHLALCCIPDAAQACREFRRVLRPGGALHLLEHVQSETPLGALCLRGLDPIWARMTREACHPARRTLDTVRAAGFRVDCVERGIFPAAGMPPFPLIWARAKAR